METAASVPHSRHNSRPKPVADEPCAVPIRLVVLGLPEMLSELMQKRLATVPDIDLVGRSEAREGIGLAVASCCHAGSGRRAAALEDATLSASGLCWWPV